MVTTESALVVADAGPLIHLDELAALDVLSDYSAVWHEVICHRPQALQNTCVNLMWQNSPTPSVQVLAITSLYTLHHGARSLGFMC